MNLVFTGRTVRGAGEEDRQQVGQSLQYVQGARTVPGARADKLLQGLEQDGERA